MSGRRQAHIFVGIATESRQHRDERHGDAASRAAIQPVDLTGDEVAKLHIRYMVGGRSSSAQDERLYRFEFPERPGALMDFLDRLGGRWNISLFHYRNHGADFGRVLAGFEVPTDDSDAFETFLGTLGYSYQREEGNPAYEMFLGGSRGVPRTEARASAIQYQGHGAWLSLVERPLWERNVAGSNPVAPTNYIRPTHLLNPRRPMRRIERMTDLPLPSSCRARSIRRVVAVPPEHHPPAVRFDSSVDCQIDSSSSSPFLQLSESSRRRCAAEMPVYHPFDGVAPCAICLSSVRLASVPSFVVRRRRG